MNRVILKTSKPFVNLSSELPIEFTKPLKDTEIMEKQTLIMSCEVNKANAKATWQKEGKPLEASDRITITCEKHVHTLTIENATLEDDSIYKCVIKDRKTSARGTVNSK